MDTDAPNFVQKPALDRELATAKRGGLVLVQLQQRILAIDQRPYQTELLVGIRNQSPEVLVEQAGLIVETGNDRSELFVEQTGLVIDAGRGLAA